MDFDVPFSELRAEALQKSSLVIIELNFLVSDGPLKPIQSIMPGKQVVATPDPANPARADLDAFQGQLLGDAYGGMRRVVQTVIENGVFDLFADPVRVWSLGAG